MIKSHREKNNKYGIKYIGSSTIRHLEKYTHIERHGKKNNENCLDKIIVFTIN